MYTSGLCIILVSTGNSVRSTYYRESQKFSGKNTTTVNIHYTNTKPLYTGLATVCSTGSLGMARSVKKAKACTRTHTHHFFTVKTYK